MIKLEDELVRVLDVDLIVCEQCGEPFGTTDDPDVEGDWNCVVGVDGHVYHSGCCVEAGKDK